MLTCEHCGASDGRHVTLCNVYSTALCLSCEQALQRALDGNPALDAWTEAEGMVRYWLVSAFRDESVLAYQRTLTTRDACGTALKRAIWAWIDAAVPRHPSEESS